MPAVILDASIDDLASESPLTGPDEHLSRRSSRRKSFPEHPGEPVSTIRPLGAAHAFLQGSANRVLVDHELGMTSANVLGYSDPVVADTEHDLAQPIGLSTAGRHNAAGIAGPMLHRVLAKLADCHQDRISDDRDIIEMIDQRLQQSVGKLIDVSELAQPGRSHDDIGVALDKRFVNATNVVVQAKSAKTSAGRVVLRLLHLDTAPGLPLPPHPERKPRGEEGMQAHQATSIQNHLVRAIKVGIKLRGVAVIACPHPTWQSQLHRLHRMAAFGSNRPFRPEINPSANIAL
jgi:hypothetical protein